MNKKNIILLSVIILFTFVVFFVTLEFFPSQRSAILYTIFPQQQVKIISDNQNFTVSKRPDDELEDTLIKAGLIDNNKIRKVNIIVTDTEDPNAVYIREDIPGQVLLTSGYTIKGNVATITLYLSQYTNDFQYEQKRDLLNYYFWESANLIRTMNQVQNTDKPAIFL